MLNRIPAANDEHLRDVLELAPIGAFLANIQGDIFFVNQAWEHITGLSQEDSLGQGWISHVLEDDTGEVHAALLEVRELSGERLSFSWRMNDALKGTLYLKASIRLVNSDPGGDYLVCYVQDITADKAAGDEQAGLTNHLQSLITSLEDIVFEVNGSQVFLNVWVSDETKLYMPREAFLGKKVTDVLGPQGELFSRLMTEVMHTGEERQVEYRHIDPTVNQWFKARIRPVVIAPDPERYIMIFSIADITEQKLVELSLAKTRYSLELSNQLLDVSQQLSQTGGWEYNLRTGEIFWTRYTYLIYEVPEDFTPTLTAVFSFYGEEAREKLKTGIEEAVRLRKPYDIEQEIITARQNHKWVRTIGMPVMADGEVVMIRGALMDISQKKKDETDLITAKDAAEEAARAKSDFLSIMSHEIRTPLNGIIGIANLLKLKDKEIENEYVSNLIFSADHLLQLINDILDLNKIDRDQFELTYSPVNIHELITNIHHQFRSLAHAKHLELVSEVDKAIPQRISADIIRLSQIMNNLISNAIHYTEKGSVTVSLRLVEQWGNKVTIHFSVKDTGIGIPEAYRDKVFESFRQVESSTVRRHSGTGLGLAITKKLVELHESTIHLDSTPGTGSDFYFDISFELPAADSVTPRRTQVSELAAYENKFKNMRLLFVEDNPINLLVATRQLEYFGVEPHSVHNGEEALALLQQHTYDVAFLDLHMPEMDGYTLSSIIRRDHPDVSIVIFTADIMPEVKKKFAGMGIFDVLNKPFFPREMLNTLLKIAQLRGIPY